MWNLPYNKLIGKKKITLPFWNPVILGFKKFDTKFRFGYCLIYNSTDSLLEKWVFYCKIPLFYYSGTLL